MSLTSGLGKFFSGIGTGTGTRSSSPVKENIPSSPALCFEVSFQPITGRVMVHVIGAKSLPNRIGLTKQNFGYVVKVKMFPGSEKLQTEKCRDQNPTWNEFFAFEGAKGAGGSGLEARQKAIAEALDRGKFIVLTIVAYDNLEKQTTIGAVTLPLERKRFSEAHGSGIQFETGRLWQALSNIDAGLTKVQRSSVRQSLDSGSFVERGDRGGKGGIEVTLCFCPGADSSSEAVLTVSFTRFRWQISSAKELQARKAELFVKVKITTGLGGSLLGKYRSEKFDPCISANLTPQSSKDCLVVVLEPYQHTRGPLYGHIRVCAKYRLGKREVLGEAWFGMGQAVPQTGRNLWTRASQNPGARVTEWLPFT